MVGLGTQRPIRNVLRKIGFMAETGAIKTKRTGNNTIQISGRFNKDQTPDCKIRTSGYNQTHFKSFVTAGA